LGQRHHEGSYGDREQGGTGHVNLPAHARHVLPQKRYKACRGDKADRHVDPEDPRPADVPDDKPACLSNGLQL
ncbi:MAG: hypothetical protein ABWY78_02940, partial [Microvirga sp.]